MTIYLPHSDLFLSLCGLKTIWLKFNSIIFPGVPGLSWSCLVDSTTHCAKGFSNSTCRHWMHHFCLKTSSCSSGFITCHQAPELETLDSSYIPFYHSGVLSVLLSVSPITASSPLPAPHGCQGDLSKMQTWRCHSPSSKSLRIPRAQRITRIPFHMVVHIPAAALW